ncbi:hypothetical protein FHX42_002483 [Saccharopolyspora lacisalsi]|uniref:Nbr1 FW domain-containing protein n=1 Tax=Halosaccharopolyspora lacisalsi TaxID=1000566 RepID=A0A839DT28_9PSEU|nr:NBR1-Ig-like domain-containing protein [Halosaccharopolyspora lacisalsi]MBA8825132.1 hypothetical protein [Halosaccharopolyspora lacisalsi]
MEDQFDGLAGEDPAKPGRKARPPAPDEGPCAALAHELWSLKRRAGDPSFATMCTKLGAAASRSSLAAATRGTTLPSWETTWEFVRVLDVERLGTDPATAERLWRDRWTAARDAARVGPEPVASEVAPAPAPSETGPAPVAPETAPGGYVPAGSGWFARPRVIATTTAGALVLGLAVLGMSRLVPPSGPAPSSDDPDLSSTLVDETYEDGTHVATGERFTKSWILRNLGTRRWEGRWLTRINSTPCSAPKRVRVPDTEPGRVVTISVEVTASPRPAYCKSYWKMTNSRGEFLLPNQKPVYFEIIVDAPQ